MRVANKTFSASNVPEKAVSTRLGVGDRSIPTSNTVHEDTLTAKIKMERDERRRLQKRNRIV
jgi:hypothetical protein